MASADPLAALTCFLCRDIYTDPVSLKCGHSFCRLCIDYVRDLHLVHKEYSCPRCNEKLKKQPRLPSNEQISDAIEAYQAAQRGGQAEEEVRVDCLYCVESQVAAVKTCVQCETPLCDPHLEAHNKELSHILIPPTAIESLTYRKCSEHNHLLQYYCSQHATCICEACSLTESHREHDITSAKEAFEKEKKKLHDFLCELQLKEEKITSTIQTMAEVRREAREEAKTLMDRINMTCKELRKHFQVLEKAKKELVYKKLQKISRPEVSRLLHQRKERLRSKVARVEALCDITDPVTLLQKVELDKDLYGDVRGEETEQSDDPCPSVDDLNEDLTTMSLLSELTVVLQSLDSDVSQDVSS